MGHFERTIRLCTLISSFFFISSFCKKQTDGFSISRISSSRPFNEEYEVRPLVESEEIELKTALNQPYTYFGRGGQAFVFFSNDGNYVVKFFKQKNFQQSWLLNHLPIPKFIHRYRLKKNWKRKDKLCRDFFSYKIAFEEFLEETGLLFVHLNPTNNLKVKLSLTDPLHIGHSIDLDKFNFIVQRRAENTLEYIERSMEQKDIDRARLAIRELLFLISHKCKKGFRDRDPNISTNCGFLGDKAIKIDVGRFVRCEEMKLPENHNEEIRRVAMPFELWLTKFYPELLMPFREELEEVLL